MTQLSIATVETVNVIIMYELLFSIVSNTPAFSVASIDNVIMANAFD